MVNWRVKYVVQGEIQCYTTLLLGDSKVHVPSFISYLEACKLMVTTPISLSMLFKSSELSNSCIFKISLSFYSNSLRHIIFTEMRGSNSDDLE